jgi:hypothetical protein
VVPPAHRPAARAPGAALGRPRGHGGRGARRGDGEGRSLRAEEVLAGFGPLRQDADGAVHLDGAGAAVLRGAQLVSGPGSGPGSTAR